MSFLKFLIGVFIFDVCAGSAVMDVRNGLINAPILVMKDELDTPAQTNWTVPGGCLMMQASIHIQVPINSTTFETIKVDPSMAVMVMGNCSLGNNNTQLIGLSWTDKNELNPKAPLKRAINITSQLMSRARCTVSPGSLGCLMSLPKTVLPTPLWSRV